MEKSLKRTLLSLLNCFGAILGYGLATFIIHWGARWDEQKLEHKDQPLAVTVVLMGLGNAIASFILLVAWPWRPFERIKLNLAGWSCVTGILWSFGTFTYIVAANEGLPADIGGPLTGLHNLVPPLWYWLYDRKCMGIKTALGFMFLFACLIFFSGLVSKSVSFTINSTTWIAVAMVALAYGFGVIAQAEAVKTIKFQQFPQIQISYSFGYTCCCIVYASITSISDVMDLASWKPFGVDKFLAISANICNSLGAGLFFVCLFYTDDVNLMVAFSSLYIAIPVILGILILDEQAHWNVILGLSCALAGMVMLAMEVKEEVERTNSRSRTTLNSFHTIINEYADEEIGAIDNSLMLSKPLIDQVNR